MVFHKFYVYLQHIMFWWKMFFKKKQKKKKKRILKLVSKKNE